MTKVSDTIFVSLGFEHLMSNLYGRSGHGCLAGQTDFPEWKKHLLRVIGSLQTMIRRSINGDDAHRDYIIQRCDDFKNAIKCSKDKDELSCRIAHFGFEISFLLLGGLPQNFQNTRTRPDLVTAPPPFRTLTYARTTEQRSQQILDAAHRDQFGDQAPTFERIFEIYDSECKKDGHRFLSAIKERYPDIYRRFEP